MKRFCQWIVSEGISDYFKPDLDFIRSLDPKVAQERQKNWDSGKSTEARFAGERKNAKPHEARLTVVKTGIWPFQKKKTEQYLQFEPHGRRFKATDNAIGADSTYKQGVRTLPPPRKLIP